MYLISTQMVQVNAQTESMSNSIDTYVEHLIKRQGIPGVALAIIRDQQIIHKNYYGYANLEHQVPINKDTIFRLYSLTKPTVAVAIFQLVEQNKLRLDDAIGDHVDHLPHAWQSIQIKHLLSHSSGLPDMAKLKNREKLTETESKQQVFGQVTSFTAGARYDYNQTNFWLLQQLIEKLAGMPLAEFITTNQFNHPKNSAFFSSDSRSIIQNRATPYFYFSTDELIIDHPYMQGDFAYAMNGLNTTLDDFIYWNQQFNQGLLLKPSSQTRMFTDFEFSASKKMFAHGWNHFKISNHDSYGFTGSYVTGYRYYPKKNLSVILLSNGLSHWYNIDNIINHITSLVDAELTDQSNYLYETLLRAAIEQPFDSFKSTYTSLSKQKKFTQANFEQHLNDVGYMLLNIKNIPLAVQVFKFNTSCFPTSWNAHDSLGEAYEQNNQAKLAINSYRKAIELNTENYHQHSTKLEEKIAVLKTKVARENKN